MNTKLIIGTFDNKLEPHSTTAQSISERTIILADPNPDWRGSILNQLSMQKFFFTFLVDITKGGYYLTGFDFNSPDPYVIEDATLARLRDVSIGYSITPHRSIRQVRLSISGRNVWTIYKESSIDQEGASTQQKGIALSATIVF